MNNIYALCVRVGIHVFTCTCVCRVKLRCHFSGALYHLPLRQGGLLGPESRWLGRAGWRASFKELCVSTSKHSTNWALSRLPMNLELLIRYHHWLLIKKWFWKHQDYRTKCPRWPRWAPEPQSTGKGVCAVTYRLVTSETLCRCVHACTYTWGTRGQASRLTVHTAHTLNKSHTGTHREGYFCICSSFGFPWSDQSGTDPVVLILEDSTSNKMDIRLNLLTDATICVCRTDQG